MHPPSQFLLDLRELCPHAITPGSPFKEEFAPSGLTADVGEPQELEGLRLSETILSSRAATASGRCFPSAFGMYVRRDGSARYAPR